MDTKSISNQVKNPNKDESILPITINTCMNASFFTKSEDFPPISSERVSKITKMLFAESECVSPKKKQTIKDFEIMQTLGKGSYAKVVLAKHLHSKKLYAVKVIDKQFLTKEMKKYEVYVEKYMLTNLDHQNIVKLYSTFQDEKKLYFLLDYCPNKDLYELVKSEGKLNLEAIKFYMAEIVSAMEYMHSKGIYHRDLKPENILLDENMHLKICDFGTANVKAKFFNMNLMQFVEGEVGVDKVKLDETEAETDSENEEDVLNMSLDLVGTPEYVAPEVLLCNEATIGPPVDLWAFGCILYFLIHGKTPFKEKNNLLIFSKILKNDFNINESSIDKDSADLIKKLLISDPFQRLGATSKDGNINFKEIKSHQFFRNINWEELPHTNPPIVYTEISINDSNFHSLSPILKPLSKSLPTSEQVTSFNTTALNRSIEGDYIIFESVVKKKSPWLHYNTRILKLFSSGRLEYYEPCLQKLKGLIRLTSHCKAVFIDDYHFDLITSNRTFVFNLTCKFAGKWVDKINQTILNIKA